VAIPATLSDDQSIRSAYDKHENALIAKTNGQTAATAPKKRYRESKKKTPPISPR